MRTDVRINSETVTPELKTLEDNKIEQDRFEAELDDYVAKRTVEIELEKMSKETEIDPKDNMTILELAYHYDEEKDEIGIAWGIIGFMAMIEILRVLNVIADKLWGI